MASELRKPTCVQVFPASVDLYTPSPGMMLPRMHDSPIPMYTTSGFESATATAPTDELLIWPSVTGFQLRPPSTVFQRPPPTAPKYPSLGRPFTPVIAMERPPRSGPMLRHRSASTIALSMASVDWATTRVAGTPNPQPAVSASDATHSQNDRPRVRPGMMLSSEKNQSLALTPVSDAKA